MLTFKQKIQNIIFPLGSIQKIYKGYLKGYKMKVTTNSLWSPLIGGWEPTMQKIMVNVVKPGQTVYDLGANNGLHGLLLSRLVGEKGLVVNFEPFAANIIEIDENYEMNKIVNYRNVQAAVADKEGIVNFSMGVHSKQGAISEDNSDDSDCVKVPSITLDSFIDAGNPGPSFIKMDIEGAEGAALSGFSKNIEKYFPDMVIELHNPVQDREVGYFLKSHQYKAYRFDPFKALHFTEVSDFSKGCPEPEGIWGTIFCFGPSRQLKDFTFDK